MGGPEATRLARLRLGQRLAFSLKRSKPQLCGLAARTRGTEHVRGEPSHVLQPSHE